MSEYNFVTLAIARLLLMSRCLRSIYKGLQCTSVVDLLLSSPRLTMAPGQGFNVVSVKSGLGVCEEAGTCICM